VVKIGIALSGGGVRATVFHLGVLLRLAEEGYLEAVKAISTVSGGSLAAGLIFSHGSNSWPNSLQFKDLLIPKLRKILTETSLQSEVFIENIKSPWRRNRAKIFSQALNKAWKIKGTIKEIPKTPEWFINSTSINTGKNWRFSQNYIGDWIFGRNYKQNVDLSIAMSASAAIPYLVGKLVLSIEKEGWFGFDHSKGNYSIPKDPPSDAVSLWDGGIYENLGVEPLYKPREGIIKNCNLLIVSDASAYLKKIYKNPTGIFCSSFPYIRTPRLFDITTDQIRALRNRQIISDVETKGIKASIVRLGNPVQQIDNDVNNKFKNRVTRSLKDYNSFLSLEEINKIKFMGTHVRKLTVSEFDNLLRHGFEVADATLTGYLKESFPNTTNFEYMC